LLPWNSSSSRKTNNDPSSTRSKHQEQPYKENKQVQLRTMHQSKESFKNSALKDRLHSMATMKEP
jgi:hypothetical protein